MSFLAQARTVCPPANALHRAVYPSNSWKQVLSSLTFKTPLHDHAMYTLANEVCVLHLLVVRVGANAGHAYTFGLGVRSPGWIFVLTHVQ